MIFTPVQMGGKDTQPPVSGILLDVVQDYKLRDPTDMYGAGRKNALLSVARVDAWRRLESTGMKRADISRLFGVGKAAITTGLKRAKAKDIGACPCCGRPYGDRSLR